MSEYEFLMERIEQVRLVTREDWILGCKNTLEQIKSEEKYLFFHMKEGIEAELEYYSNNYDELEEIIEILDETYSFNGYHKVLASLIDTKMGEDAGMELEYLILEDVDFETKEPIVGYFTLPKGGYDEFKKRGTRMPVDFDFKIGGYFS